MEKRRKSLLSKTSSDFKRIFNRNINQWVKLHQKALSLVPKKEALRIVGRGTNFIDQKQWKLSLQVFVSFSLLCTFSLPLWAYFPVVEERFSSFIHDACPETFLRWFPRFSKNIWETFDYLYCNFPFSLRCLSCCMRASYNRSKHQLRLCS